MTSTPGGVDAFEQMKTLLLGDTAQRLEETAARVERLNARVGDEEKFAAATGSALLGALKHAEEKHPRDLSKALAPSVVSIIQTEIKNSKDMMVEALYPIMGRLVTAAVAGAFSDLVESLNARIDALVSAKSWRLRMRAMATGRSVAEVALAEAEAGRLKRALLLERGSGRLLAVWPEGAGAQTANADLESGMIAAITEFAANVYAETGGELRMLDLGAGKVMLRASGTVIVAGEFGGQLARVKESRLDNAFLSIVEQYEQQQEAFTSERLGALLEGALADDPAAPRSKTPVLIFAAGVVALLVWFSWTPLVESWRERRIRAAYDQAMAAHPALARYPLRLDINAGAGEAVLRGLAPDESETRAVIEAIGPAAKPYRVAADVTALAPAQEVVALRMALDEARKELGATRATLDRLMAQQDAPQAKLRRFVDNFAIFFTASDTLVDPAGVAAGLDELAALLKASGGGLRVIGHADEVGAIVSNRSVSRKRADKIVNMLLERGVPRNRLALVSRSIFSPIADAALDTARSRRVTFETPFAGEFDIR